MRTLKLIVAYDGAGYAGWQVQRGRPTLQGTLEAALERIIGQPVRVLASGRTDAGVHALGQVVGLQASSALSTEELRRALNAHLPPDVAVLEVAEAPEGFHPTRQALRKRYRYVIHDGPVRDVFRRRFCWHYARGRLDAAAMHRAAAPLQGTHDFRSFETRGAERHSSIRTVFAIEVRRGGAGQGGNEYNPGGAGILACPGQTEMSAPPVNAEPGDAGGDWIFIEVEADGFLYNMVRAIVGTLVEVGRGARAESWPEKVLQAANRRAAGPTAPPQGLFLVNVNYV